MYARQYYILIFLQDYIRLRAENYCPHLKNVSKGAKIMKYCLTHQDISIKKYVYEEIFKQVFLAIWSLANDVKVETWKFDKLDRYELHGCHINI